MQEIQSQDGFVDNLYLYLWMQDPILKQVPNINIPETIIYRNNRIFQWYFYVDKQIKKKSKNKLNNENVQEKFLKNIPKCGIVAVWIQRQQIQGQKQEKLIYEYLDQPSFINFLGNTRPNEIREGILQQFVQPKSEFNQVIKVIWSQNLCFFEKIESTRKLNDKNQDIYQRVLTYEVPNTNSTIKQMKGVYLMQTLENQAHVIKQHISNISFDRFKITQMTLIFKLNSNEDIKLISCSNIKVSDKKFDNQQRIEKTQKVQIGVPSNIDLSRMSIQKPLNLKLENQCGSCQDKIDQFSTYPIKLRYVIQSWDFDHDGKKSQINKEKNQIEQRKLNAEHQYSVNDFKSNTTLSKTIQKGQIFLDVEKSYNIPKVLRNLMPKLKEERYFQLKNNPGFLDKDIEVCEQCYLDMMASCNIRDDFSKLKKHIELKQNFNGVGQLKPEVLNSRFNLTRKQIQIRNLFEDEGIQFDPQQSDYEFNGYFQLSGDNENDAKNYNSVLSKVGLKVYQRSQLYMDTLNKNIVKENTKPIQVIRDMHRRISKRAILERSKTKSQQSQEDTFKETQNEINLNSSKDKINNSQSQSKIFPSQHIMNQSYANSSQGEVFKFQNNQLDPIYSKNNVKQINNIRKKRGQLNQDHNQNQNSMHSTTYYPSILTNEKSQNDICSIDINQMIPSIKNRNEKQQIQRNSSMPYIKTLPQLNESSINILTLNTPSKKEKYLNNYTKDLPKSNFQQRKLFKNNNKNTKDNQQQQFQSMDLKQFYKTHANDIKKFKKKF